MKELAERMEGRGWKAEWADVVEDLERVKEIRIETDGKTVYLRSELKGEASKAFQSVGVAVPPSVRILKKYDSSNTLAQSYSDAPTTIYVVPRILFRFVTSCLSTVIFYLL
jgi:hypothetical protein